LPTLDPYLGKLTLGNVPADQIPEIRVHLNQPQTATKPAKKFKELKPSQFWTALEQGTPGGYPETFQLFAPQKHAQSHFSVSHLEVVDALLQKLSEPRYQILPTEDLLNADEATQLGTLTHAAIERLDPAKPEQSDRVVELVLFDQSQPVREKLKPLIQQQISAWYESEVCNALKAARVHYRELDFLLRMPVTADNESAVTVTGMIDTVYQTDDHRWVVIDYKTGARLAQLTDEELISEYEFQLGVYTLAIEQLIGGLPDSVGLAVVHDSVRFVEMKFDANRLTQI
ncbi:MAG: PD-(D/E)XK nuclease family protein, partial [Planctomycetaceae bacterium]|nr:PD-(D/E)XK nuclease family protein [Planctomycetaceae bacterium]